MAVTFDCCVVLLTYSMYLLFIMCVCVCVCIQYCKIQSGASITSTLDHGSMIGLLVQTAVDMYIHIPKLSMHAHYTAKNISTVTIIFPTHIMG